MSEETKDKLAKPIGSLFAAKKVGVAAKVEAAKKAYNPTEMKNRIIILADDSGSMAGDDISNAKKGISEFLKTVNPTDTSIGIYGFNHNRRWPLSCDMASLDILKEQLQATEITPLYHTLDEIIEREDLTRVVVFSDGQPTDYSHLHHYDYDRDEDETYTGGTINPGILQILNKYKAKGIPVDTVYIGAGENEHLEFIAKYTDGLYIVFKETGNFAKAFKYLTPAFRHMLTDGNFRKEIGAK
jgi:Mg-chelatase subunit ChlD